MPSNIEIKLRELVNLAWRSGDSRLAMELEATAYRCLGINLNAEREEALAKFARLRGDGSVR